MNSHIWIVIIQSLTNNDQIKSGRGLSIDVEEMCKGTKETISEKYYEVSSRKDFVITISDISNNILQAGDSLILHIDSHGDECGIGLNHDFIFWEELFDLLSLLYEKTNHNLGLIISTCRALYSTSIKRENHIPCSALIASYNIIHGGIAGLAFKEFYKGFIKSRSISKAFDALTAYYTYFEKENPFKLILFEE